MLVSSPSGAPCRSVEAPLQPALASAHEAYRLSGIGSTVTLVCFPYVRKQIGRVRLGRHDQHVRLAFMRSGALSGCTVTLPILVGSVTSLMDGSTGSSIMALGLH